MVGHLDMDGLGHVLNGLPKLVQEDDIVKTVVEAMRHLQADMETRKVALVKRVTHIHDQQGYGL